MMTLLNGKERTLAELEQLCKNVDPRLEVKGYVGKVGSTWDVVEIGLQA